jgi:hypothetical protein
VTRAIEYQEMDPMLVGRAAQLAEQAARAASPAIGAYALWLHTLGRFAQRRWGALAAQGLIDRLLGPELAASNGRWLAQALTWGTAIRELDKGRAQLVPYTRGNDPTLVFAVEILSGLHGALGWWAAAAKVLKAAAGAMLAGGSFVLGDLWGQTSKLEAETANLREQTRARLAEVAAQDPRIAAELAKAMSEADKAAARGAQGSWWDEFTGSVGAGTTSAVLILGLLWFLSSRRGGVSSAPRPARPRRTWTGPTRTTTGLLAGSGGVLLGLGAAYLLTRDDKT